MRHHQRRRCAEDIPSLSGFSDPRELRRMGRAELEALLVRVGREAAAVNAARRPGQVRTDAWQAARTMAWGRVRDVQAALRWLNTEAWEAFNRRFVFAARRLLSPELYASIVQLAEDPKLGLPAIDPRARLDARGTTGAARGESGEVALLSVFAEQGVEFDTAAEAARR